MCNKDQLLRQGTMTASQMCVPLWPLLGLLDEALTERAINGFYFISIFFYPISTQRIHEFQEY